MAMAGFAGQKTVASSGTPEALGTGDVLGSLYIKALTTNTGLVQIRSSDATSTAGYQLAAGQDVLLEYVDALSSIYIHVATNGEGVSWLRAHRNR